MKILCVGGDWVGNLLHFLQKGIIINGGEVEYLAYSEKTSIIKSLKLHHITKINDWVKQTQLIEFNDMVKRRATEFKPDILFLFNEGSLITDYLIEIKRNIKCRTVCFLADNPFDSIRFKYLPLHLPHFDDIFYGDRIWLQNIQNVAPNAKLHFAVDAFDPDTFYPIEENKISEPSIRKLKCDVSFTGSAYGMRAEGGYRAGILGQLSGYDMKIFGGDGWDLKFKYFPVIEKAYSGERLSYEELRELYALSKVNLNIPNPQVFTSFQARVFEIAGSKGFQIIDYRPELDNFFSKDEIVTYKSVNELKDKMDYYLSHKEEREQMTERLYDKVIKHHTWEIRTAEIMEVLLNDF